MMRPAYQTKFKYFQFNIEVLLLIYFFTHQICFPTSVVAFPTLQPPAGHICVLSFEPYYEARGPFICYFRSYNPSADVRFRSGESGVNPAPDMFLVTDPFARFNIHLYLDHMWHLNIGFSK